MFCINIGIVKKCGLFLGGVLFGTAGIRILSSRDAKNCYVQTTAAVLRAKDCMLDTAQKIQENAEDVLARAKDENEKRMTEEILSEEASGETAPESES